MVLKERNYLLDKICFDEQVRFPRFFSVFGLLNETPPSDLGILWWLWWRRSFCLVSEVVRAAVTGDNQLSGRVLTISYWVWTWK